MKTTTEGRLRAKQRHIDEKLQRDRENEQEEEKRMYVIISQTVFPFFYMIGYFTYLVPLMDIFKDVCDFM